jgi:hypothetical protein
VHFFPAQPSIEPDIRKFLGAIQAYLSKDKMPLFGIFIILFRDVV